MGAKSIGVASDVLALLDFRKTAVSASLYCDVQAKLIPAYERLGLSCEMVGRFKEVPNDVPCNAASTCPSDVPPFPIGIRSYRPGFSHKGAGVNIDCTKMGMVAVSK